MRLLPLIALNLVTMAIAAVVTIAVIEGGMRLYYYGSLTPFLGGPHLYKPDPKLAFTPNPSIRTSQERLSFIVPITTNTLGMRGPEIGPKEGKFRIALTGDGHVFGSGLSDEETLPVRLQEALRRQSGSKRYEVVNASGPSYNTVQQVLRLGELLGKLDADLLILAFNSENDIHYNTARLRKFMTGKPKRPVARLDEAGKLEFDFRAPERYHRRIKSRLSKLKEKRPWYEQTALYLRGRVFWRSLGAKGAVDPNISLGLPHLPAFSAAHSPRGLSAEEYGALWQEGWAVTSALILALRDAAEAQGARFALTVLPSKVQVDPKNQAKMRAQFPGLKIDLTRINRMIDEFGKTHNIPVLETYTPLADGFKTGDEDLQYRPFDSHMTPKAHGILAEAIAEQLLARKLVPAF